MVDPPRHADASRPFLLARGRVLHDGEREMDVALDNGRNRTQRDEVVEVHEQDASSLGVSEGDVVDVVGKRDRVRGVARFTSPHPGLVSVTSLFGDLVVRLDASSDPDPMFRVPGLPLEPVRLERVETAEVAAAD